MNKTLDLKRVIKISSFFFFSTPIFHPKARTLFNNSLAHLLRLSIHNFWKMTYTDSRSNCTCNITLFSDTYFTWHSFRQKPLMDNPRQVCAHELFHITICSLFARVFAEKIGKHDNCPCKGRRQVHATE